MHLQILVCAVLGAAPFLGAQSLVTVPNGYENLEGTSAARTPFGWASGRVQYLVDGDQLCTSIAVVTELQLRLDGGNFNVDAPVPKQFQCRIDAYEVTATPATMASDWASNIGSAAPTTVYDGLLDVAAAQRQLPYPNPWTLSIVLSQPLVYTRANGNLLLDITVTGGSGDNWPADGFFLHASEARGEITRIHEDTACSTPSGTLTLDVASTLGNGVVGADLRVNHQASPAPGAAIDFVLHVASFENRVAGGVALPVPLAVLGAPQCLLNVDPQFVALEPTSAGGHTWPLPTDPAVAGTALFTQAVGLDTVSGALVPSQTTWQVRVGAAVPPPGPAQMVHRSNYSTQTTGALSPTGYYGLVMGFVGAFQ